MNPTIRLIRRLLLLPIAPADERERLAGETACVLARAERDLIAARDGILRSTDDLADLFDDLLGNLRG